MNSLEHLYREFLQTRVRFLQLKGRVVEDLKSRGNMSVVVRVDKNVKVLTLKDEKSGTIQIDEAAMV